MMNRRQFLTTTSAAIAASTFPGCSGGNKNTLRVYSWADYLDPDLAKRFESANSCKLEIDTFDSNEAMYAKLAAGATGYDVLVPSSYMVKTLIRENRLQPLDHAKMKNLQHVDPGYLKRALDPEMKHSVPYMMAPTCLAWLASKVSEPVASYAMFDREDLKGRITLLDDIARVPPQFDRSRRACQGARRRGALEEEHREVRQRAIQERHRIRGVPPGAGLRRRPAASGG
jgi:spermidine/putrescine transport system substrate-binding protein